MVESKEKYKIMVMALLLAGACFLSYYFHAILETGMVFTPLFYIPIILAALWWRRKGLAVTIFLAVLLILSHIFVRPEVVTATDYLRVLMFIVIAFVVAALSERIAKSHENGPMNEITFEMNQRRRDGTHLPVEITGSLFTCGGQRLAPAIACDITERKWAEAGGKNHEA